MDLTKFWVLVVFLMLYEQSSLGNNVNVLSKNHRSRSRSKKSVNAEVYVAVPPNSDKSGIQDGPPTLIRLETSNGSGSPNKIKGKFPTPIERFVQRIQNYFSVYNPPEYLNDLRPGIYNPEYDTDRPQRPNDSHVTLPYNGTSTVVIIPVPLYNDNDTVIHDYGTVVRPGDYGAPTPSPTTTTTTTTTTPKPKCPEVTTTPKSDCPEVTTTPKPDCPEVTTTPKPACSEATTPKPNCPEPTTPKPNCPEPTTPKPNYPEPTTPKPVCSEATTPKPNCPEPTTPKPNCPEPTTPKPKCPEPTTRKPHYHTKPIVTDPKPISGYGPTEVPPLNLVAAQPIGSTVVYFYKHPVTSTAKPAPIPLYYLQNTQSPNYEEYTSTRRPQPPIMRLKQMLFPRLYAAFHPDE